MTSPTDPFRFDDRSGHYGAGQADLAPVSPLAAVPRLDPADRPVDPRGASPDQHSPGQVSKPVMKDIAEDSGARAPVDAVPIPPMSATTGPVVDDGPASTPATLAVPLTIMPEGQAAQNTTLTVSGEVAAEARAEPGITPQGSGTSVALLAAPSIEIGGKGPTDFAATAMQMNQMMAEMTSRLGASSPWTRDEDDDDTSAASPVAAFGDAQDRLDALFDGLRGETDEDPEPGSRDPFADARDRIDDLLDRNPVDGPGTVSSLAATSALDDARGRLDDLLDPADTDDDPVEIAKTADAPTSQDTARDRLDALIGDRETGGSAAVPATSPLLAQLFDGHEAPPFVDLGMSDLSERFGDLGDLVADPLGPASGPTTWDDLPDFG